MLYAVVGNGTGNKTEIIQTLKDLKSKAAADDADFWFSLIAKETLTTTDKVILQWLQENEIWYDVIGDADEEVYFGASRTHGSKDPYRTTLGLLTETNPKEGAVLLALYVDSEGEDEADNELATLAERTDEEGIEVRLLNGEMVRLDFSGSDEDEPEVEEDDVEGEEPLTFTEAELKAKGVPELRAIARSQGIDSKDLRKPDLVVALMAKFNGDEDEAPVPVKSAVKKSAAAARAVLAAVPDEEDEDEIDAASIAASTLDSRGNSKAHAAIVVFVDGAVTMLPVSIGHARAILAGK